MTHSHKLSGIAARQKEQLLASVVRPRLGRLQPVSLFVVLELIDGLLIHVDGHLDRHERLQIVETLVLFLNEPDIKRRGIDYLKLERLENM